MADRNDDDAWFDALRGKPRSDTGSSAAIRREGEDLRRALHARRKDDADSDDAAGLERLLFRLRREGLLKQAGASPSQGRRRAAFAFAATLVLGIAVVAVVQREQTGEEDTLRSGAVQSIEVDGAGDVAPTVARVESALRGAGAEVQVFDIGGGAREVAATVPTEGIDAAQKALKPLGVQVGRDGAVRIDVRIRSGSGSSK